MLFKKQNSSQEYEDNIRKLIDKAQQKANGFDSSFNKSAIFSIASSGIGVLGVLGAAKLGIATIPLIAGATIGSTILTAGFAAGIVAAGYGCFSAVLRSYQENKVDKMSKILDTLTGKKENVVDQKVSSKIKLQ
jgi:hypothetical protein